MDSEFCNACQASSSQVPSIPTIRSLLSLSSWVSMFASAAAFCRLRASRIWAFEILDESGADGGFPLPLLMTFWDVVLDDEGYTEGWDGLWPRA